MKLMKSLILFVFVSAIWGLYSKPSPQQHANNPTYYDPAEQPLNKINNAFLSYYRLPADCAKLNNITFSPAQANLSAPTDSLSMKETADRLLTRWLNIAKQCGDDYEFLEGKVEV